MTIKIIEDERTGTYTLVVDGDTILECLSEPDISDLTIGEISELVLKSQYGML